MYPEASYSFITDFQNLYLKKSVKATTLSYGVQIAHCTQAVLNEKFNYLVNNDVVLVEGNLSGIFLKRKNEK